MTASRPTLRGPEFIALAAFMMSVFALSIDITIPALALIGRDLAVANANDAQYVVSVLVLGMALGQIFYGPLSDSIGRKPSIYVGLALFAAGSIVSMMATDFPTMLAGRLMQGLGAAGPRIVVMALVRDQFNGPAMARIMSLVITVFVAVPMVAPFIGQGILFIATWRAVFVLLLVSSLVVLVWFAIRQPETLTPEARRPFRLGPIVSAAREVLASRPALAYTTAAGFAFGSIFGYINSAQQIFQDLYRVGDYFPLYFSSLTVAVGAATLSNARLVATVDMHRLCSYSAWAQAVLSIVYFVVAWLCAGVPPLWATMAYLAAIFYCLGILFGNLNALAMAPMGHIAGIAASVIGTLSWLLTVILGTLIGQSFDGTLLPLVGGFALLSLACSAALRWARSKPGA
jgi:DHA1 family bicyclomycin/chloramphenicol resistance-like MFS transporter